MRDVSELTGFPEMMDGRVKTLHPKVHGGLLAVRDDPEHAAAMAAHGIGAIDLVVVNLYPVRGRRSRAARERDEIIENIDIGGPSMVRSAAKNHRYVDDRHRSRPITRALLERARRSGRRDVARFPQAAGGQGVCRDRRLRCDDRQLVRLRRPGPAASPTRCRSTLSEAPSFATARTRTRRRRFYAPLGPHGSGVAPGRAGPGQGAQLQQLQRCRRRARAGRRVPRRRAGLRHRQARQSVRRRHRRQPGRGL